MAGEGVRRCREGGKRRQDDGKKSGRVKSSWEIKEAGERAEEKEI